jgi:hypothetical protein
MRFKLREVVVQEMSLDLCPGLVGGQYLQGETHCWLFFHQTYAMNILQDISQDISELFRFDIDIEGRVFGVSV